MKKISRKEVVEEMAERSGVSRLMAEAAYDAVVGGVASALREGRDVGLPGLGTLRVQVRAPSITADALTRERVTHRARRRVGFRTAADLQRCLAQQGPGSDTPDE